MSDWYNITAEDIWKNGGQGLLNHYNGSPSKALLSVFPDHKWVLLKFNTPKEYWDKKENQRVFFDKLKTSLKFTQLDDYYHLKRKITQRKPMIKLIVQKYGSPFAAMGAVYPEHNWDRAKFAWQ